MYVCRAFLNACFGRFKVGLKDLSLVFKWLLNYSITKVVKRSHTYRTTLITVDRPRITYKANDIFTGSSVLMKGSIIGGSIV